MQTAMQWYRETATPYLTFVVKGCEQSAREQLFVRGIVAQTINHTRTETVFACSIGYRDLVAQ